MSDKIFLLIHSKNGASYALNAKNWQSIGYSLEFYKPQNFKSLLTRECLRIFLFLGGKFKLRFFKSPLEIEQYLEEITTGKIKNPISTNSSVLISPTRNKIIINDHNKYFRKIAFGDSYEKVKNEGVIYKLLINKSNKFKVSDFLEMRDIDGEYYSFKMITPSEKDVKCKRKWDLVDILIEFFKSSKIQNETIEAYFLKLQNNFDLSDYEQETKFINKIIGPHGQKVVPLGLVHRDFKPWNIKNSNPIIIYDFEETIKNGLPLEDLMNYYIDPIIRYKKTSHVADAILSEDKINHYHLYLNRLNIDVNVMVLLFLYLFNRMLFWKDLKNLPVEKRFKGLFHELMNRNISYL